MTGGVTSGRQRLRHAANAVMAAACLLGSTAAVRAEPAPGSPLPPESYAMMHLWGGPSVVNTRHLSMGGAFVADNRSAWHGNPAGSVAIRKSAFLRSEAISSFSSLPKVRSGVSAYAHPFGRDGRNVLKLALVPVRMSGAITGGPVPLRVEAREDDLAVEFSRRVSPRLSVGVATAYLETNATYRIDGVGTVSALKSRPSGPGGRLGVIYDVGEKISIGATYDNYTERVIREAPALQLPAQSFQFHSTGHRVGVALRPDGATTVLVDYEAIQLAGNRQQLTRRSWMGGVERRTGDLMLRAGCFDGKLTGGVAVNWGKVQLSYGFTGRDAKSLPGQGARTAHAFQITVGL